MVPGGGQKHRTAGTVDGLPWLSAAVQSERCAHPADPAAHHCHRLANGTFAVWGTGALRTHQTHSGRHMAGWVVMQLRHCGKAPCCTVGQMATGNWHCWKNGGILFYGTPSMLLVWSTLLLGLLRRGAALLPPGAAHGSMFSSWISAVGGPPPGCPAAGGEPHHHPLHTAAGGGEIAMCEGGQATGHCCSRLPSPSI